MSTDPLSDAVARVTALLPEHARLTLSRPVPNSRLYEFSVRIATPPAPLFDDPPLDAAFKLGHAAAADVQLVGFRVEADAEQSLGGDAPLVATLLIRIG